MLCCRERKKEQARTQPAPQQAQHAQQHESRRIQEDHAAAAAGDAAWRAAKAAGSASLKLASYEARWEFFCTKNKEKPVKISNVPWILPMENNTTNNKTLTSEDLGNILLQGADSYEEKRQILRRELIRWHPDKFTAQFGKVLVDEDRERILEAVTGMSQLLTQLHTEIQAERK